MTTGITNLHLYDFEIVKSKSIIVMLNTLMLVNTHIAVLLMVCQSSLYNFKIILYEFME